MAGPAQTRITAAMCAYGRGLAEPRLAPDASRVAFLATAAGRGQLVVVPADGGPELVVTSDPPPRPTAAYGGGAFDWTPDGEALVYAAVGGGLWWVPATGGPSRCIVAAPGAGPIGAPAVAPDGRAVAFVVDQHHVLVAPLDPSAPPAWPQPLSSNADFCFDPTWSPDGAWVAWHEWDVPAMPWDASRIAMRRAADAGTTGDPLIVAGGDVQVQQPRFSPDGRHIAYLSDERGWLNVWVADADGANARPLVEEEHEHGDPSWGLGQRSFAWSPDSAAIACNRNEAGFGRLVVVDVASGAIKELGKAVHGGSSCVGVREIGRASCRERV